MEGLLIKSTGSAYLVRMQDGSTLECHVKGNFRIRGIRTTNPVAVGDRVEVFSQPDGTHWIVDIQERKNYVIRRSTNLSKEAHIIASNVDMAALLVTINHPVTNTIFIDRFLATCEAYRVRACLIFNKIDLYDDEETERLKELRGLYESLGYSTFAISAKHMPAAELRSMLQLEGHVTLFSGNSGVGKSTLLNAIFGEEKTRTGNISSAHNKGMHTTTFSEMYELPGEAEGWIIDTPGIKGFGSIDMQKTEVCHYFKEIFAEAQNCKYSDCLHVDDPGCAVTAAVEEGRIAFSRYESYLSMLGDCEESKYR